MKRLLGSIIIACMIALTAQAKYSWSIRANKRNVVVHEAVEIVLRCRFSDEAYGYFIELQNIENPDYEIHLLFETESQNEGKEYYEYRYVLFPKRVGELVLNVRALMKQTSKESIENSVVGRDNVEELSFDTTAVQLPLLHLQVTPAPAPLVGTLQLSLRKDAATVTAYKPLHVSVIFEGTGNLQQVTPFELKIPNATVFSEKPEYALELSANGYSGTVTQRFAVVAYEDYDIPAFRQQYWNVSQQQAVLLTTPPSAIRVMPAYPPQELLDNTSQIAAKRDGSSLFVSAVALFFLGFVTGRYLRHRVVEILLSRWHQFDARVWRQTRVSKASQKRHNLRQEIRRCHSVNALLVYLIVTDSDTYGDIITALDSNRMSLSKAKTAALKRTETV